MEKIYPIKHLEAYTREDADYFFGRNEEINTLYEMVFQSNIVMVYGASGTGKTSLIQCGLAARFKSYDWLPVFIRRGTNINESLEKKLSDLIGKENISPAPDTKESDDETSKINTRLKNIFERHFKSIYLIFDQFEEIYILGTKDEQNQFIRTIKDLLAAELPVKVIFSIREEYLGHLFDFEKSVPGLMRKKLRIEPMSIEKVREVIEGINHYDKSNIRIREGETEAVSDKIFEKIKLKNELSIQLPYLQVFLDQLYLDITGDQSRKAGAEINEDSVKKSGSIGDVLGKFLEERVKSISKHTNTNESIIWEILSPFASLEGTKKPVSKPELYNQLNRIDRAIIDKVVQDFTNSRILRQSEADGLYEIVHDSLAKQIAEKRSEEEIGRLKARRLIDSQMQIEAAVREKFTEKQLAIIEPFRKQLMISSEEEELIKESIKERYRKRKEKIRQKQKKRLIIIQGVAFLFVLMALIVAKIQYDDAKKANTYKDEALSQANEANARSERIISHLDFYDDKYVLIKKYDRDYFIDIEGNIYLDSIWDHAQLFAFENMGLAETRLYANEYLIDTSGNVFRVAYKLEELNKDITALDLSESELTAIPASIFEMPQLEVLKISINKLDSIPSKIITLKKLKYLDLGFNQLTYITPQISELSELLAVNISNNHLITMPIGLLELTKLKEIRFAENKATTLNKDLEKLSGLSVLDVGNNPLKQVPEVVFRLTNLKYLRLESNQLETLSPDIAQLINLETLILAFNNLEKLPQEIKQLKHLKNLDLVGNQLNEEEKEKIRGWLPDCEIVW